MIDRTISFVQENWFAAVLIIGFAWLAHWLAMMFLGRIIQRTVKSHKFNSVRDEKAREETLTSMLRTTLSVAIWSVASLILLAEVGVDIAPLLAGAGILGVALGFGAQSLVKDFLAGFFIVAENQYRVGDVIQINKEIDGIVERITMRETVLRDLDGMVHHIPNGNINIATNMTMDYANINLDVGISYSSDIEKVEKIVNEVGTSLANDEKWKERIIEAPSFLRVDEFADSAIIIKIMGKTVPMEQWPTTGELRKRLKIAFDKNGIEIPFPQVTLHQAKK